MAYKLLDLTNVNWIQSTGSFGTNGCYFKTKLIEDGIAYYYKLSSYNSAVGFYGHESVNEVIFSRLCKALGIPCAEYKLVKVKVNIHGVIYETFACKAKSYRKKNEIAISIEDYYIENRLNMEDIVSFMHRKKASAFLNTLFIIDYICINRDRHGANVEILTNNGKERLAPLFDNGLSFVCSITQDMPDYKRRLEEFNVLADLPVNNYIGQRSLMANLSLITQPVVLNTLSKSDKQRIFYNMAEVIPEEYKEKIWQIIVYRYMFLVKQNIVVRR